MCKDSWCFSVSKQWEVQSTNMGEGGGGLIGHKVTRGLLIIILRKLSHDTTTYIVRIHLYPVPNMHATRSTLQYKTQCNTNYTHTHSLTGILATCLQGRLALA